MTSSKSENHAGVYAPGSMIFNPPGQPHRITTGGHEPCLLAYAWVGPESLLANEVLTFDRNRDRV